MEWFVYVLACILICLVTLIVIGFIQREFKKHLILWSLACGTYFLGYVSLFEIHPVFKRVVHPIFLTLGRPLSCTGSLSTWTGPCRPPGLTSSALPWPG
ncbi:MAG: hypothetical protein ACM3ZC_16420 [Bacteroidota bacterium]